MEIDIKEGRKKTDIQSEGRCENERNQSEARNVQLELETENLLPHLELLSLITTLFITALFVSLGFFLLAFKKLQKKYSRFLFYHEEAYEMAGEQMSEQKTRHEIP